MTTMAVAGSPTVAGRPAADAVAAAIVARTGEVSRQHRQHALLDGVISHGVRRS